METLKYSLPMTAANTHSSFEKSLATSEIGKKRRGRRGGSTKVMWVDSIDVEWEIFDASDVDKGDMQYIQLTTNAESAEVKISDKDCFWKAKIMEVETGTAASGQVIDIIKNYPVDRPYLKDELHIGIGSAGLNATYTLEVSINYHYQFINDWQFNRIIASKA